MAMLTKAEERVAEAPEAATEVGKGWAEVARVAEAPEAALEAAAAATEVGKGWAEAG